MVPDTNIILYVLKIHADLSLRLSPRQQLTAEALSRSFDSAVDELQSFDANRMSHLSPVKLCRVSPADSMSRANSATEPQAPVVGHRRSNSSQTFKLTPQQAQKATSDARQAMQPLRLHARTTSWQQSAVGVCNPYDLNSILGLEHNKVPSSNDLGSLQPARSPPPPATLVDGPRPVPAPLPRETDCVVMIPGRKPVTSRAMVR